jgi:hypothetical protein
MRSAVEGRRGTDDVVGSTASTLQGFFWGVRSGEAVGGHIVCEVDPTTKTCLLHLWGGGSLDTA